jgi:hypothetical protein
MKNFCIPLLTIIFFSLSFGIFAQTNADALDRMLAPEQKITSGNNAAGQDSVSNDIIRVNYSKKDARLAMLLSGIVPGAGQFYTDKYNFMAYVYPVIELAIIGGIVYYNHQGNEKVKDYKKYANGEVVEIDINGYTYRGTRYRRDFQQKVETLMSDSLSYDIYDDSFFSLDSDDTQHFFEDIGKYPKYIFGWADWYLTYGEMPDAPTPYGTITFPDNSANPYNTFVFTDDDNDAENLWLGNRPLTNLTGPYATPHSQLKDRYVKMRQQAEDKYNVANLLSFGIAFNHIISAIDAARVTNARNRLYLSENKVKLNYYAAINNGQFTPMVGLRYTF